MQKYNYHNNYYYHNKQLDCFLFYSFYNCFCTIHTISTNVQHRYNCFSYTAWTEAYVVLKIKWWSSCMIIIRIFFFYLEKISKLIKCTFCLCISILQKQSTLVKKTKQQKWKQKQKQFCAYIFLNCQRLVQVLGFSCVIQRWSNVMFFPSMMIRPYEENLLTENRTNTKLMLIIDNTDVCCQKCMDGGPLLHIYRPSSAKVIVLIHQLWTFE